MDWSSDVCSSDLPAGGDAGRHEAFGGVADEGVEARLAFGLVRGDLDRLMDEPGAERRGRGREDEGAAAVDEEVAGYRGGAEQGALGAERLAAGVKGDQIVAAGAAVREAGAAGAEHAGRSEERRVGNEGVSTGGYRGAP